MSLGNVSVVLVRPRGAANVGAVARAMKNTGISDLVLVRPELSTSFVAQAMAVHAQEVLAEARQCDSLASAVAPCALVVGTTCRAGGYRAAVESPREAAARIVRAATANRVALVFGPEDHGLSNEDLKACQLLLAIPTAPAYPSLNLAQAVLVCCYELFLAAQGTPETSPRVLAPAAQIEFMFRRLQEALLAIGFLHPGNPEHIMFSLRRILGQADLDERDVRIFLALARQIEWSACSRLDADSTEGGLAVQGGE